MISTGLKFAQTWAPAVLRLPRQAPPGITLAVVAAAAAHFGWLAGPLELSRPAEVTLGIVMVATILWVTEAVPLFVTSLLVLALELTWLAPTLAVDRSNPGLFLNAFFSDVTLLFLGGFVLSAGLERTRLDRRLARLILKRSGGSPKSVLIAVMGTTALLSMWMSNTAACALMLGLASTLLGRVPAGDGFRRALVLGIAFSANLGGVATPIGSPPNAIMMRYLQLSGQAPSFALWIAIASPLLVVLLVVVLFVLRWRFPTKLETVDIGDEEVLPWRRSQTLVLVVLGLTVAGWLAGGRLGITAGTVALLPVVVFFGTNLLQQAELRSLPWDVLLLIGGGLALGAAIDQSGLATWVSTRIPSEGLSPLVMAAVVASVAAILSAGMSNTAAANLVAPMIVSMQGVSTGPLLIVAALACSVAMPLPVSTPPNAMAFGFTVEGPDVPLLRARDMVGPGMLVTVLGLAGLIALAHLWLPVLGI